VEGADARSPCRLTFRWITQLSQEPLVVPAALHVCPQGGARPDSMAGLREPPHHCQFNALAVSNGSKRNHGN
jgi:hypothetical protein